MMMNPAEGRGASGGPKRPKRLITDARKEQNRIAQKLFRQRQKERAQSQETPRRALPGKHRPLKPRQTQSILPETSKNLNDSAVSTVAAEPQIHHDSLEHLSINDNVVDISQSLDPGFLTQGTALASQWNGDKGLSLSGSSTSFVPDGDSGMLVNHSGYISNSPCVGADAEEAALASGPNSLDIDIYNQPPLSSIDFNSPGLMELATQICATRQHEILGQRLQLATSIVVGGTGDSQNTSIGPSRKIPGVEVFVSAVTEFLDGRSNSGCTPISSLADPYRNVLQSPQTATLVAYLHNARCIGLDLQDLLVHESPFYNPITTTSDDPQALLATVRKPWIPVHLQPTLPQVLMQYHPWLDLLPFPVLRARAIMLGAATPRLFHPMELKRDIFSNGISFHCHCDRIGSGQPWDIGS